MKNLKKALAAVIAMSVVAASNSAFAAVNYTKTLTGGTLDYDAATKTVQATVSSAEVGEQMTFLLLNDGTDVLNIAANNILYIDQKEATSASGGKSFSAPINLARVGNDLSDLPDGTYPVRFGYYDSEGDFQIASGSLVKATTIDPAITAFTLGDTTTANVDAGTASTLPTVTVTAVGGASTAYTWAVTAYPAGVTASDVTLEGNSFTANKIGQYTLTATSTFDGTQTATLTVTANEPSPALNYAGIDGKASEVKGTGVVLTGSHNESAKTGVTYAWSITEQSVGGATLSAASGTTVTLSSSVAQTVTVQMIATSAAGTSTAPVTKTVTFTEPEPEEDPTITIKWGDINMNGTADLTDALLAVSASAKHTGSWKKTIAEKQYTFTFNSDVVDVAGVKYNMVMPNGVTPCKWADTNVNGSADLTDALLSVSASAKHTGSWLSGAALWNEDLVLTLKSE